MTKSIQDVYVDNSNEKVDDNIVPITKVAFQGSEALALAILKEKPSPWTKAHLRIYVFCIIAFLCSTMNGFDGSLFTSLQSMTQFRDHFGVNIVGAKIGLITGMYTIGGVVALLFVGPACDTWGRRAGMFIGCFVVVVGTVVSATSQNLNQFLGGRFLLGFGVSIAASAAPTYCVEISPPIYRGVLTGLYNCTYYVGAITAAGATRGSVKYTGNLAWRVPIWCQLICPSIVCLTVFLTPESPRWLFSHGKKEQAREFVTKYHGEGNPENSFVTLQMSEYEATISLDGSDKRPWDFRELFNTRGARYRVLCMMIPSVFAQWSGSGVVGYYLTAVLASAGITNDVTVLNMNLGNTFIGAFGAYLGASQMQRFGRRKTLIGVCIACSLVFLGITIGTSIYSRTGSKSAATASLVFIFLFAFWFSLGWTPLQALYPVEVLSYEQRAKGMALSSAAVNAAALLNQFAMPVALERIGWHTYIVFIGWNIVQAIFCYFFAVETNGRTLEELSEIFEAPNPRKASTGKVILARERNGDVEA
ncbi:major facilitator superfamily domain, general substrate transporter [Lipomyces doorenjongii]|uniref:major facilitator superfamily domain, general substrate transporter n=1 Tax=Lipomyces doorenjongii TaxID=383834 RepID=UPI0034CDBB51